MIIIRTAYSHWFAAYPFDLAITINANWKSNEYQQGRLIRAIDGTLNRVFLGPRYSRLPQHCRLGFAGVPEKKLLAFHFHIALEIRTQHALPTKQHITEATLDSLLSRNGLLPRASIHVQPYRDAGWLRYILKSVTPTTHIYVNGLPMTINQDLTRSDPVRLIKRR